jgi:hypothetical protein
MVVVFFFLLYIHNLIISSLKTTTQQEMKQCNKKSTFGLVLLSWMDDDRAKNRQDNTNT